jgi:NADH-quinone oxidoreductase subunit A
LIIAIIIAIIILGASIFLAVQKPDTEKLSIYECGFDPYEDSRNKFDVRFYIVAILFIIFDLETVFCFP